MALYVREDSDPINQRSDHETDQMTVFGGCHRDNQSVLVIMHFDNCMNDTKVLWDELFIVFGWSGSVTYYSYCG